MKRYKKFIIILLSTILIIYIGSYIYKSRVSMYLLDGEVDNIWAFGSLRQQMELYFDEDSDYYKTELRQRNFYLPLIKIDKYIFGNYHILENDLPDTGG